jgi:hypothetical protein
MYAIEFEATVVNGWKFLILYLYAILVVLDHNEFAM